MAILLFAFCSHEAHADCPAAPLTDPDDMVVSFLALNGTQAASGTLMPSTVKEGMLVYDETAGALKICDGTNWVEVGSGGGSLTLAGLTDVSVGNVSMGQVLGFNGTAWVPYNVNLADVAIPQTAGTIIGDMTSGGGNAAAFDGNNAQDYLTGAYKSPAGTVGYVGKDWGAGNDRTCEPACNFDPLPGVIGAQF